jgi:Trk K+ transport system NAD-binding subunit
MKMAVVGLGNIGSKVAANLAASESVIVSLPNMVEARAPGAWRTGQALPVA